MQVHTKYQPSSPSSYWEINCYIRVDANAQRWAYKGMDGKLVPILRHAKSRCNKYIKRLHRNLCFLLVCVDIENKKKYSIAIVLISTLLTPSFRNNIFAYFFTLNNESTVIFFTAIHIPLVLKCATKILKIGPWLMILCQKMSLSRAFPMFIYRVREVTVALGEKFILFYFCMNTLKLQHMVLKTLVHNSVTIQDLGFELPCPLKNTT